jgi:hypothetical protein
MPRSEIGAAKVIEEIELIIERGRRIIIGAPAKTPR